MNFGFNSNIHFAGAVYHVQTEDRGPAHPFMDTVVYQAGMVVHKRSTSYADLAGGGGHGESIKERLHERLAQQHRDVIAQLEAGTLPLKEAVSAAPPEPPVASYGGLELRLLNPKAGLASGSATLEVELRRAKSTEEIAGADVEAFLEAETGRSAAIRAKTNAQGRAMLKFPLPSSVSDGTTLVIRATDGDQYGELRFRLKARSGTSSGNASSNTPAVPSKAL